MSSADLSTQESTRNFPVIYLTGAPATGKSSLCQELADAVEAIEVFEYGAELTAYLNEKHRKGSDFSQDELRRMSAKVANKEDIEVVDDRLLSMVKEKRRDHVVLIDSHAVTKESYGFRVTGFDIERIRLLEPTHIVCLYAWPGVVRARISQDSGGRPHVSGEEAEMHAHLQSSVAIGYGLATGAPVYFFDSSVERHELVNLVRSLVP